MDQSYLGEEFGLRVTEVQLEDGTVLKGTGLRQIRRTSTLLRENRIPHPGPKVQWLARVKGVLTLAFPLKEEKVRIANPLSSVDKVFRAGKYEATITKCEKNIGGFEFSMLLSREEMQTEASKRDSKVEVRARLKRDSILMISKNNQSILRRKRSSHSSGKGIESYDLNGVFEFSDDPEAIEFDFVSEYFEKQVEFELTNVALPSM